MVTTRGQSGNKQAQSSPVVEDIAGVGQSKKRRLVESADDKSSRRDEPITTPTKKKQKKLPLRNKDEEHFERHSHFEVEIPVKEIASKSTERSISSSKGKSTDKWDPVSKSPGEAARTESEGEDLPDGDHTAENATKEAFEDEKSLRLSGKISNSIGHREMANTSSKQAQRRDEKSSTVVKSSKAVTPKHKRFGSEDLAVEEVSDLAPAPEIVSSEDSDNKSDDDAPEVVEKHDAQERARTAVRIASKAAEEQNAIIRKKRKERDLYLKEQAKLSNKKIKVSKNDERRTSPAPANSIDEDEDSHTLLVSETPNIGSEPLHDDHAKESQDGTPSKLKSLLSKSNLPEYLPAEYLEDNPVELSHSSVSTKPALSKKPKKTNFVEPVAHTPKDRIKNGVVYRVSESRGDTLLAPKAVNNAKSVKEAWMRGRTGRKHGSAGGGSRRVPNTGFFVNRR